MRTIKRSNLVLSISILCLILMVLLSPLSANAAQIPEVLVAWCPISSPTNSTAQQPTYYVADNSAATLTRTNEEIIRGAAGGTRLDDPQFSYSYNAWHSPTGQWWQLSNISTYGFENIQLSFSVRSTNTGPKNFALQYSTGDMVWHDVLDSIGDAVIYSTDTGFHQEGPFLLPAAANDSGALSIRFLNTDTVSVNDGTTVNNGVSNISDIIITGTPIIEDEREIMSEWFITLENANNNHAYYASNSSEKPQFEATGGINSATSAFWVEKFSATLSQSQPINTSYTTGSALYAGGVRYQGLGLESFFIIETSSAGFADIEVNWAMRCSNAAPANYQLQYSIDYNPDDAGSATWIDVGDAVFLTQDIPIRYPQSDYTRILPSGADNQQKLFIRLLVTDNASIQGNTVDTNGVFSINDIIITGTVLSNDAGLTSVKSQQILAGSEEGTSLDPKTASISVANNIAAIAFADIIASDANAVVELYSDREYNTLTPFINLTEGDETHLYIKITAENGTEFYYDVAVNRAANTYALTVINGTDNTGGSPYVAGAVVFISANAAPAGRVFDKWISLNGGSFADANSATTTFAMPAEIVTIVAIYKAAPIIKDGGGGSNGGTIVATPSKPTDSSTPSRDKDKPNVAKLNTERHIRYISGYASGEVKPFDNITRAEIAQIFYSLLIDKTTAGEVNFSDIKQGKWYYTSINTLASLNVIEGYSDGSYRPDAYITRAEFTAIVVRFANPADSASSYSDVPSTHWAFREISTAQHYGWINGYPNRLFMPDAYITRAEAVAVVNRVLGRSADRDYVDANMNRLNQFVDLTDNGQWFYYDIIEAANAHEYEKDYAGFETWQKGID